ncbi:hypothetical protein RFI_24262, partial [Reticulomyxa filosa]
RWLKKKKKKKLVGSRRQTVLCGGIIVFAINDFDNMSTGNDIEETFLNVISLLSIFILYIVLVVIMENTGVLSKQYLLQQHEQRQYHLMIIVIAVAARLALYYLFLFIGTSWVLRQEKIMTSITPAVDNGTTNSKYKCFSEIRCCICPNLCPPCFVPNSDDTLSSGPPRHQPQVSSGEQTAHPSAILTSRNNDPRIDRLTTPMQIQAVGTTLLLQQKTDTPIAIEPATPQSEDNNTN